MKRFVIAAWLSAACFGQTFEVASVKPNLSGDGHSGLDIDGNLLRMTNRTLKACITWAFDISDSQVVGPAWLETERFDIVAKSESGKPSRQMLEALLKDRFRLALHRETKELTVYVLVVAKNGPKLKKTDSKSDTTSSWRGHISAEGATMARLVTLLAGPNVRLGRPVIDKTGLGGAFNFELNWTPEGQAETRTEASPSIFTALQEQLGLKLESQKSPVEVLVVDRAEKVPAEN